MQSLSRIGILGGLVVAMLSLGCAEPPPPPEENEPPPPTAAEIASELRGAVQPIANQFGGSRQIIPPQRKQEALSKLRTSKQKYLTSENGPEGIRQAGEFVQEQITQAYDNEAYSLSVFAFEALEILQPHMTENFDHYRDRAQERLNQPRVLPQSLSFIEISGENVVIMDVFDPETNQTHNFRVREGEEFLGYRLNRIMNNNAGIVIEYLPTGEEQEVLFRR